MLTKNIKFLNYFKADKTKLNLQLKKIKEENILGKYKLLNSLTNEYLNSYTNLNINKYKKYKNYRIIGMGGSVLGSKAIYNFLIHKIKKNFFFKDNLNSSDDLKKIDSKTLNVIISKSNNSDPESMEAFVISWTSASQFSEVTSSR